MSNNKPTPETPAANAPDNLAYLSILTELVRHSKNVIGSGHPDAHKLLSPCLKIVGIGSREIKRLTPKGSK